MRFVVGTDEKVNEHTLNARIPQKNQSDRDFYANKLEKLPPQAPAGDIQKKKREGT